MAFPHRSLAAIAAALVSLAVHASYHTYQIDELYSNADGTVQYVVLHEASGMNGQNLLAGHTLTAMHGAQMKSFAFTRDLPGEMCGYYSCMPSPTAGTRVLIATDGFTALGLVTPDYVVPNGFLPVDGGTVNYAGADTLTFAALPTDGLNALYRDGTTHKNLATNFARDTASVALAAVNYQGLWWATGGTESGWGINFVHQGDRIFGTWYTYDTTGKAWWLSMLAAKTNDNKYEGDIVATAGPPFNTVPIPPIGPRNKVGTGTLTFTDVNNGSFAYTVNTSPLQMKYITRFDLGTGAQPICSFSATALNFAGATNYQDLWWVANGSESGWGINFAHQGNTVFATWYTYDIDGTPLWLSVRADNSGGDYAGPLYRTSGPHFDAYDATKVVKEQVGSAKLTFADGNHATFHYETNGSSGLPAAIQSKTIVRFPFTASGGTLCQ